MLSEDEWYADIRFKEAGLIMALKKNKVKFGLNKVHWAKITGWSEDGVPTFATPVRIPGAVSLSIDANGENENFYGAMRS